ncbi:DsbA family protein [Peptoniphilus equinus]|uniref:DsbA family protein n=1 Tax=Peptoniphilus equinus TaxID=3016343 RepID=A0ABY7QWJ4_9FIRM|nr:DsbA family protein [Peptoniphilus equinus]WBW50746.1 DsbA family protein [Peptoniphilus equinus]
MKLTIFTDVVDTWSWGEEKVLRALQYLYGDRVKFEFVMGGMIEDYRDLLPQNMKDQDSADMANGILHAMWTTGVIVHGMPISDVPPKLFTPNQSSTNRLDEYVVAVREVAPNRTHDFLRRLREATLVDGKVTTDPEVFKELIRVCGIDETDVASVLNGRSRELFLEDRMATFDRRVERFPTFMYTDDNHREYLLKGYQRLDQLVDFIQRHHSMAQHPVNDSIEGVKAFIESYPRVFEAEVLTLFAHGREHLDQLLQQDGNYVLEKGEIKRTND